MAMAEAVVMAGLKKRMIGVSWGWDPGQPLAMFVEKFDAHFVVLMKICHYLIT